MTATGLKVVAAFLALLGCAAAVRAQEPRRIKLSAGLEASIGLVGRAKGGRDVTATMTLRNAGSVPVQLLFVGAEPQAIDNAGTSYRLYQMSGVAQCRYLSPTTIPLCIGRPEVGNDTTPLEAYTQLDPGTEATVTFLFRSDTKGLGATVGIAATLAYRNISDQLKDNTLAENQKRASLRTMNLSFPQHLVVDAQ